MRALLLVFGFFVLTAAPAAAQEMPAWAAPAEQPAHGSRFDCPSANPNCIDVQPALSTFDCPSANPNCIDIEPAPVSSGLALLALLGTGYAVRRLRRDPGEDDD